MFGHLRIGLEALAVASTWVQCSQGGSTAASFSGNEQQTTSAAIYADYSSNSSGSTTTGPSADAIIKALENLTPAQLYTDSQRSSSGGKVDIDGVILDDIQEQVGLCLGDFTDAMASFATLAGIFNKLNINPLTITALQVQSSVQALNDYEVEPSLEYLHGNTTDAKQDASNIAVGIAPTEVACAKGDSTACNTAAAMWVATLDLLEYKPVKTGTTPKCKPPTSGQSCPTFGSSSSSSDSSGGNGSSLALLGCSKSDSGDTSSEQGGSDDDVSGHGSSVHGFSDSFGGGSGGGSGGSSGGGSFGGASSDGP